MPVNLRQMMRQSKTLGRHTAEYRERERLASEALLELRGFADPENIAVLTARIEEIAREYPEYIMIRVIAASYYAELERLADAFRHIAIALAVDPYNPLPHKSLARLLKKLGDDAAIPHVMEAGWRVYPAWGSKADIEAARERWFKGPSESERAAMAEDIRHVQDLEEGKRRRPDMQFQRDSILMMSCS